ncbi:MAG: CheR family methyltransferase [Pseudomonadota bacterium]
MRGALSLKPSYYEALKRLTLELAGVRMGSDHAFLVETRLASLARDEGFASLDAMIQELFGSGQTRLAVRVVSALVERDTHFNRDPQSLDILENFAMDALSEVRGGGRVDILSYGCGSGQDVYSIAMRAETRRERGELNNIKVNITGIDYPSQALERARAGRYTHFEVQRGLSAKDLVRWFTPTGDDEWQILPEIRERVDFQEMHLLSGFEDLSLYHAVVFRGALSHYSAPAQVRVLRGLAKLIRPYGYLLLGTGEHIGEMHFGLDPVAGAPGLYRKRDVVIPVVEPEPVGKQPTERRTFGPRRGKDHRKTAS